MKGSLLRLAGVLAVLAALLVPALEGASKKKPAPPPAITRLAWLAGNWRTEINGRLMDEQWMAPAGGLMLGMMRTVAKGRLVDHKFLQIREGPGGDLFYVLQPAGQKEAALQITSLTETGAVFENPENEFPQKISYTLQSDGSLLAAVEGPDADGGTKRAEYSYQRVQP